MIANASADFHRIIHRAGAVRQTSTTARNTGGAEVGLRGLGPLTPTLPVTENPTAPPNYQAVGPQIISPAGPVASVVTTTALHSQRSGSSLALAGSARVREILFAETNELARRSRVGPARARLVETCRPA